MKILIAADIFPPEAGGPATYAVTLANELVKQGVDVRIVSLTKNSDQSVLDSRVTLRAVGFQNFFFRYLNYFGLLLHEVGKVDCVYAMGPMNAGLPALLISRLFNKKCIVKVVGDYAWEQGTQRFDVTDSIDDFQHRHYPSVVGWLQRLQRFVVESASAVIVPSEYLRRIVIGWGARAENVTVMYNAVNVPSVDQSSVSKKENPKERWIVSVGRLVPWKGMSVLIDVMKDVRAELPNVRLKIIGDGPEFKHLQDRVRELSLSSIVELTGKKTHDETLAYITSADVFVLNSGYEGLSHVIIEALAYAKPVLASNVGGNPEIITPGKTGELFEYNNHEDIKQTIISFFTVEQHYSFLHNPTENADFFRRFSVPTMVTQTKKFLETLCARS